MLMPSQFLKRCSVTFISVRPFSQLEKFGNVLGGEKITEESLATFAAWHNAVSTSVKGEGGEGVKQQAKVEFANRVHENITFHPPTYFKKWEGKEFFLTIIECVGEVFGSSFSYGRQWVSPDGRDWALEFKAKIGESSLFVNGIDLVKLDENGKIIDFMVLARPPNGVAELKKEMMKRAGPKLALLKAKQFKSSIFG